MIQALDKRDGLNPATSIERGLKAPAVPFDETSS